MANMTEREFQNAVVELAHMFKWRVFHARAAGTNKGWRTPVAYDGKGYPDLTLVHERGQVIFAELKAAKGTMSDDQEVWRSVIEKCAHNIDTSIDPDMVVAAPVAYYCWKPVDAPAIGAVLSFGRVTSWKLS